MNFSEGASILIPSWNNFEYLKYCVESIQKYSSYKHEIIVHLNEADERSISFLKSENIKFTCSSENLGVCKALNIAYKSSTKNIIGYFNDDMVALPEWDKQLNIFSIENNCDNSWILASTMIEPRGNNPCCIAPMNFGTDIENFNYKKLEETLENLRNTRHDVNGSTWPPNFISRFLWEKLNGYSEEYGIGFGSDPDLIAKAYLLGCRRFIGVGKSLVYHFQCKTTAKVKSGQIEAEEIFKKKFDIEMSSFIFNVIQRGSLYIKP
jgi:glycosyltransferase involved in cell wall biosynthesis